MLGKRENPNQNRQNFTLLAGTKKPEYRGIPVLSLPPSWLAVALGVLQELQEVAIGVDDHDVVFVGEGVLIGFQTAIEAIELTI